MMNGLMPSLSCNPGVPLPILSMYGIRADCIYSLKRPHGTDVLEAMRLYSEWIAGDTDSFRREKDYAWQIDMCRR